MSIERGQTYRNTLGAELTIQDPAWMHFKTLGGDGIWIARSHDSLFGSTDYLVTAESLAGAGYALAEVGLSPTNPEPTEAP